jgi:hypothetical protein
MNKVHLILQGLILFSWIALGLVKKNLGYCLLTDLQITWNQKFQKEFPDSYMIYLYSKLGVQIKTKEQIQKINLITFIVFAISSILSLATII